MSHSTRSGSNSGADDRLDLLADEFAERFRRGERPSLEDYAARHPDLADDIRALFPALVGLEQAEEVRQGGPAAQPDAGPSPPPPWLSQVGDFRIIREIGHGGMGVVYEAEQVSLGRRVALKMLPRDVARNPSMLERFRREARAAARLHHTNIVPVFEVGREADCCYYAMQFIQGQGLDLVYDEVRGLRNGGKSASRATGPDPGDHELPPGGVGPPSGRAPVGLLVHSLLTGRFEPAAETEGRADTSAPATTETVGTVATDSGTNSLRGQETLLIPHSADGLPAAGAWPPASASAVFPGGSQISTLDSGGSGYYRSVARIGLQAAQGLAYAHSRGVIHRDIKPSNLLLDTAGVVWIADFGLAKADDDAMTQTGDLLGTLRYMAPERFRGGGDARADIYALGLTLHELLTLQPAFDAPDRLHLIEQVKSVEPSRPRLLDHRIPLDLETIVLKAIDKDAARRYPTADEMAEDLRRFLDDEPILARRTTLSERLVRWGRHNPGIATLGAALAGVLVLATAVSMVVAGRMIRLADQRQHAADGEREARLIAEQSRTREAELRALAENALRDVEAQRRRAEENFALARTSVDEFFTKVSESQLLSVPGLQPLRHDLLRSALAFYEDFLRRRGQEPGLRSALAAVHLKVARSNAELDRKEETTRAYREALTLYESLRAAHPDDPEAGDGLAESCLGLGELEPDPARARDLLLRAVALREGLRQARPDDVRIRVGLARAYQGLGDFDFHREQEKEALRSFLKARDLEASLVRDHPEDPGNQRDLARNLGQIADCLCRLGRHQDETIVRPLAIEHARTAFELAPQVVAYGRLRGQLLRRDGNNLANQKRHEEAERSFLQAVAIQQSLIRENPAVPNLPGDLLDTYRQFLSYLESSPKPARRIATLQRACETFESFRRGDPEVLFCLARLYALRAASPDSSRPTVEDEARRRSDEGKAAEALLAALAAGYRTPEAIAWTPELVRLGERADVKAMIAGLTSANPVNPAGPGSSPTAGRVATGRRVGSGPSARDLARYQADLAASQHAIGLIQLALGDRAEGTRSLNQAAQIREAQARGEPGSFEAIGALSKVRMDLATTQWQGGYLAEAADAWRRHLDALDEADRRDRDGAAGSPFAATRKAVADLYVRSAMWEEAATLLERVVVRPAAARDGVPGLASLALDAAALRLRLGDEAGYRRIRDALDGRAGATPADRLHLAWLRTLGDRPGANPSKLVEEAKAADPADPIRGRHVVALALYRAGQWDRAIAEADPDCFADRTAGRASWPLMALAHHRLGHAEAARDWLARSEDWARRQGPGARADDVESLPPSGPIADWQATGPDWLTFEVLCREAGTQIDGRPPAFLAADHLHRARIFGRLNEPSKAEAEYDAAVAIRPDDPAVWLGRGRAFARQGLQARAEADFARAGTLETRDPRPWIEQGRFHAARGESGPAQAAYGRAAARSGDELNRFIEAGWWVAGPFPASFEPPDGNVTALDPARPIPGPGAGGGDLPWTVAHVAPLGQVGLEPAPRGPAGSTYALTHVDSPDERTATLLVGGRDRVRVWLNGRLIHETARPVEWVWGLDRVSVALRAGRNTILARIRHESGTRSLVVRIADGPLDRGNALAELGLWREAADLYAGAIRRGLPEVGDTEEMSYASLLWATGDREGHRDQCRRMARRLVISDDLTAANILARASGLAPDSPVDFGRLADLNERWLKVGEAETWRLFGVALSCYRAGRSERALEHLNRLHALTPTEIRTHGLLALVHHQLGHTEEARRWLARSGESSARVLRQAAEGPSFHWPFGIYWGDGIRIAALDREARTLLEGVDPGKPADLAAFEARGREVLARSDPATAAFDRAVLVEPDLSRLRLARARRRAELGRWEGAEADFAAGTTLQPEDHRFWAERGRFHADLGLLDRAAADDSRALDLIPADRSWSSKRSGLIAELARSGPLFDRLTRLRPGDDHLWTARGRRLALGGQWLDAARDYARGIGSAPIATEEWSEYACLLLLIGDEPGYRACVREVERRAATAADSPMDALVLARVRGLSACAGVEPAKTVRLAEPALLRKYPWSFHAEALALHRAGRDPEAIERIRESDAGTWGESGRMLNRLVSALAEHRLGRDDRAREALQEVGRFCKIIEAKRVDGLVTVPATDWLALQLLRREAESLILHDPVFPADPFVRGAGEAGPAVQGRARAPAGTSG